MHIITNRFRIKTARLPVLIHYYKQLRQHKDKCRRLIGLLGIDATGRYQQDALLNNTSIHLTIPEYNALLGLRRPTVDDYAHPLSEKHRSMFCKLSPIIVSMCLVTH